jgi:hypothetical protein
MNARESVQSKTSLKLEGLPFGVSANYVLRHPADCTQLVQPKPNSTLRYWCIVRKSP